MSVLHLPLASLARSALQSCVLSGELTLSLLQAFDTAQQIDPGSSFWLVSPTESTVILPHAHLLKVKLQLLAVSAQALEWGFKELDVYALRRDPLLSKEEQARRREEQVQAQRDVLKRRRGNSWQKVGLSDKRLTSASFLLQLC